MPVFSVCDPSFKTYALGNLYCHVLAFRIDTEKEFADLQVTDYTSKQDIAGDRPSTLTFTDVDVSPTEILQVTLSLDVFNGLAEKYQATIGEEFFARLNATLSQNNWVILHEKLCLANLQIKLQKKPTHLMGNVQHAFLLSAETPGGNQFLDRFLERCGTLMKKHASIASKVIGNLSQEAIEQARIYLGPLAVTSDSTSYSSQSQTHIKEELILDDQDLQQQLRNLLEPAFQPAQPPRQSQTQSQYLTQLQSLQRESQQELENFQLPDSDSQQSHVLSQSENLSILRAQGRNVLEGPLTLAQLNRISLVPDNRIYTTSAFVVGTIPQDLSYVCTKVYELKDGKISLSDPHIEQLEFILLDSNDTLLSSENSLVVSVPNDNLMEVFGLQYREQLYTQLENIKELFKKRKKIKIQLDLKITSKNAISVWTTHNLDLLALLRES